MLSTLSSESAIGNDHRSVRWWDTGFAVVALITGMKLVLHLVTANRYGFWRDEFYFMACGQHLDWGYVEFPPLIAVVAWFSRAVFGSSLLGMRLLPAIASAGLVALTGWQAYQLSGKRFAMGLSALGVACAGVFMIYGHLLTMNAFEPLIWMGCASVVIAIIQTGKQKLWIWFGLLAGIGLETKYSITIFGLGLVVGLLLTSERKAFARKWIWIAGALALLVFLPNLIWNVQHHWPFVEWRILASPELVRRPLQFALREIVMLQPVTFPLWVGGLVWLFFSGEGRRYRVLGWAYLVVVTVFILLAGKDYYAAPAYPMLFAAGGVACEQWVARTGRQWLKPAFVFTLLLSTIPLLPLYAPILSMNNLVRYLAIVHVSGPENTKVKYETPLDRVLLKYKDENGWESMVVEVARVYNSLPPETQRRTAILCSNFGECGAVDFYGPKYGLPKSIGTHQNYYLWGSHGYTGESIIIIQGEGLGIRGKDMVRLLASKFDYLEKVGQVESPYAYEVFDIYYGRELRGNLQDMWPKLKLWYSPG